MAMQNTTPNNNAGNTNTKMGNNTQEGTIMNAYSYVKNNILGRILGYEINGVISIGEWLNYIFNCCGYIVILVVSAPVNIYYYIEEHLIDKHTNLYK